MPCAINIENKIKDTRRKEVKSKNQSFSVFKSTNQNKNQIYKPWM